MMQDYDRSTHENPQFMSVTTLWPAKPGNPATGFPTAAARCHGPGVIPCHIESIVAG